MDSVHIDDVRAKKLSKIMYLILFLLITILLNTNLFSQGTKVNLNNRTVLDQSEKGGFLGFHVTPFCDSPKEKLILPEIRTNNIQYFDLFLSHDFSDDENISALVIKKDMEDILYIDLNNDEDLSNDGNPFIFSKKNNILYFDITINNNDRQFIRYSLKKKPLFKGISIPDTLFLTKEGNLKRLFYTYVKTYEPTFEGEKGTFYIDETVSFRRGKMNISNQEYSVGIYDYNNNGLFNEESDLLFIDKNLDGYLTEIQKDEIFKLDDIFQISNSNYKITDIDSYGSFFYLQKTEEPITSYFLAQNEKDSKNTYPQEFELKIEKRFWNSTFQTIEGEKLNINSIKDKYLLLNFWGEWCKPCIAEIPEIINLYSQISKSKLEIISFLRSYNVEHAKRIIHENKMDWTHILLDEKNENYFKIIGYPTNILISPNREIIISTGQINSTIIKNYIK